LKKKFVGRGNVQKTLAQKHEKMKKMTVAGLCGHLSHCQFSLDVSTVKQARFHHDLQMSEATRILSRRSSLVALFVAILTIYHLGNDLVRSPASLTSSSAFFSWSAVDKRPSSSKTNDEMFEDIPSGPAKDVKSLFDEFHASIAVQGNQGGKHPKPTPPAVPPRPPPSPPAVKPATTSSPPSAATALSKKTSTGSSLITLSPSFNFTIPEASDGCTTNETKPSENAKAVFSDYPTAIAMNNLVEIMQAGISPGDIEFTGRRIAMCKLRRYGNYAHFPHMMQVSLAFCLFFQRHSFYFP
jgi:hypothetical protein